mgnify:FL=1
MVCGLGTVHAAARVNHFGFQNNDADAVIGNSPNTLWHAYSQSSPRSADEGINLAFRFDELEAGASVSFSFAYVLSEADLEAAMASINALTVTQPTDTVGGVSVLFACSLENVGTSNKMDFFVTHPAYNGGVSKKNKMNFYVFCYYTPSHREGVLRDPISYFGDVFYYFPIWIFILEKN